MQRNSLTLAVAALLVFGAGGVAAASVSHSPTATTHSPADAVSQTEHTVEVVDPHDRLSEQGVDDVRELAWSNDTVQRHVDDEPVHFHVEAVGESLQVYVAPNSSAPPTVMAEVDLDTMSVEAVEPIRNVATADDVHTTNVSLVETADADAGERFTVHATSASETLSREDVEDVELSVTVDSGDAASDTIRLDTNETAT